MAKPATPVVVVPLQKPPVHNIVANADGTFSLVHSDSGRSHISCADMQSALKEKARLDALSALEKF